MRNETEYLRELKGLISKEKKALREVVSIFSSMEKASTNEEKDMANSQINSLRSSLRKVVEDVDNVLEDMAVVKPLPSPGTGFGSYKKEAPAIAVNKIEIKKTYPAEKKVVHSKIDLEMSELEKKTLKRLKKTKQEFFAVKEKKANKYVSLANKFFGSYAQSLSKKQIFDSLKRDLVKANLQLIPSSYIALMLFTALIAAIIGVFLVIFLLFFNIGTTFPIITRVTEGIGIRFLKTFWILFAAPIGTFLAVYVYPSIEKAYIENRINQELPFATIHMSAISGALIEPSKIFSILISTRDYPFLQREFTKIINEINVYGYDFVTALRNVAFNSPSLRLAELLNGLATTITSGGDLADFFEKRAQSLLFEYQIEREKYTKTAETFMDIYISLVIAAPMILMLLLIMMEVSGLGISLSSGMITLVMILGVTMINIIFLTFLQLKQPTI